MDASLPKDGRDQAREFEVFERRIGVCAYVGQGRSDFFADHGHEPTPFGLGKRVRDAIDVVFMSSFPCVRCIPWNHRLKAVIGVLRAVRCLF